MPAEPLPRSQAAEPVLDRSNVPLQFSLFERLQHLGFADYIAFFQPFGTSADPPLGPDLPSGITMHEGGHEFVQHDPRWRSH